MKNKIDKFLRYLEVENDASKHTLRAYQKDLESFNAYIGDKDREHRDDRYTGLYSTADQKWPQ